MMFLVFSTFVAAAADAPLPSISMTNPRRFVVEGVSVAWTEAGPLLAQSPSAAPAVQRAQSRGVAADLTLTAGLAGVVAGTLVGISAESCLRPGVNGAVCAERHKEGAAALQLGGALLSVGVSFPLRLSSYRHRRAAVQAYNTPPPLEIGPPPSTPPEPDVPADP